MSKRILIVQAHPDSSKPHFCHAMADAYAAGATSAGHALRRIEIAALEFPLLRSRDAWEKGDVPADVAAAQKDLLWAEHVVVIYPLWLGDMPALLKAFFEQIFRPGFAFALDATTARKPLKGRSARIIVTMGMPAAIYRYFFGAHSLKSLKRNILGFVGFGPVRDSVFGMIESGPRRKREKWLAQLRRLGALAR